MNTKKYEKFTLYENEDKNIFIHIDIEKEVFYKNLISYFFEERKILNYVSNKTNIEFTGTEEQFVSLYKDIGNFIDEENLEIDEETLKNELKEYIDWNCYGNDVLIMRKDKIGKVGEYILHNVLSEFFGNLCLIPKLRLITDKNMSVYGIDTVFFNPNDNTLMFGESKVSKNLDIGIGLINRSLKEYEKQISDEFVTTLSHQELKYLPSSLKEYINKSISFQKFIEKANINTISIPLFIMHGEEKDINEIFEKLQKIKKEEIFNLNIKYIIISMPIIDKNILQSQIIEYMREKSDYYESNTN